jgi:PAS domain S-box-containing protein
VETAANLLGKALQHHRLDQQFAAAASLQKAEWEVGHAALAMLDRNLRIKQINRAFAAISGYTLVDVQDRPFAEIAAQPGSESSIASTLQQLAPGDPPRSLECGLLNKEGVKRHLAWSFMAVQLPGQELQFLASGMDVSDRQEALERAQRAEAKADTNLKSLLNLKTAIDTGDMMQIRQALIDAARTAEAASDGDESMLAAALLNANRRTFERGQFRSTQRIAPFTSGQIPHPSAFFEVQCHELSAGGFSFFLPHRPKDKKYLVRLGAGEHTILMSVEVRSCRLAEEQGIPQYLVGCKFVERIQR